MAQGQELLAALGIGGARMRLYLPQEDCPRNSILQGVLALSGGNVTQKISALKISLTETAQQAGSTGPSNRIIVAQALAARNVTIGPNQHQEFPFQYVIPDQARLSGNGLVWRVEAVAEIGLFNRPQARASLNVVMHGEIIALQEAMLLRGFTFHNPFTLEWSSPNTSMIITYYRPPNSLRDQLERCSLSLDMDRERVTGTLRLYRRDNSLQGQLKSLTGGNAEDILFSIPRADLKTTDGMAFPQGALAPLDRLFAEALTLPGDARKNLLRPTSAPTPSPDELLRPAQSAPPESPDELLRPVG